MLPRKKSCMVKSIGKPWANRLFSSTSQKVRGLCTLDPQAGDIMSCCLNCSDLRRLKTPLNRLENFQAVIGQHFSESDDLINGLVRCVSVLWHKQQRTSLAKLSQKEFSGSLWNLRELTE